MRTHRTLLMVEDSPEDRVVYRRFLSRDSEFDYTILEATLGQQALDLCQQSTPDCILLDYQLPDMDGITLLHKLVASAQSHIYPIVMLTGAADVNLAVRAMKNGVHDFLNKDRVTLESLQQALNNAIEKVSLQCQLQDQNAQLRQITETLEQQVYERTLALAQSNQELERSNRELEQFAYVASHDLKAPLRAINNLAQWISQDAESLLPHQSKEHLKKLHGRVARMENLLEDLLTYSRAGRVRHSVEKIDLALLVKNVLAVLTPPAEFKILLETSLSSIRTERVPLETVLRNLIGNAIKHHHRLNGQVIISAQEAEKGLLFSVSDDGPGIATDFHTRIFEIFQTLKPRDKVEGSGMGLSIIKKIIESRGGAISVDSAEGRGAIFRFLWKL